MSAFCTLNISGIMSIPRVEEPVGSPSPYILPDQAGEAITLIGTKSTIRVYASSKETEGAMSVFAMNGVSGDAPGFHYHNEAHDIFMCTKGRLKVWAGDECKILGPGDFCSVPPTIIHCPQLIDPYNETIGLVTPGAWLDFFRFIGEKYNGVVVPEFDNRDFKAALFPKFQQIRENYDVIFQPQHKGAELSEWTADDTKIPSSTQTYYLKANTGPRYLLGGVLSRPFINTKQCDGKFAITSIESSRKYGKSVLERPFSFAKVHQVFCVLDGSIEILKGGEATKVVANETAFIPAGSTISLRFTANYVRIWVYSSGNGLESFIQQAGGPFEGVVIPETPKEVREQDVKDAAQTLDMTI